MTNPERPRATDPSPPGPREFWIEIRAAVEAALALSPAARGDFLDRTFADNVSLRKRAHELLVACEHATGPDADFLAVPASAFAASLLQGWTCGQDNSNSSAIRDRPLQPQPADVQRLRSALADRYQLEGELARGGAASVYLARDLRHDRLVALKVLDPMLGIALSTERFLQEIRVTAGLAHPHILPLHDSGDAAGRLYYVMPFIEGETLRDRIARQGALPVGEVMRIFHDVADALAYAHDRGVVHRDIKPGNILLAEGHALVADFGIARAVQRAREQPPLDKSPVAPASPSEASLTLAGTSPGTPAYMAPEQARGATDVDHRADLYALGVVVYEALIGSHPFGTRSRAAMLTAHLEELPKALEAVRLGVAPAFTSLVLALLAKDPAYRPQSARAVLQALHDITSADTKATAIPSAAPTSMRTRRLRRTIVLTTFVLSLAILVGYLFRGGPARNEYAAGAPPVPGAIRTLAVLPFTVTGADAGDEYFGDGITDELAHALARLPTLRIAGRTSSYAFKGKHVPAPDIGRELGVEALLIGAIRRSGERLRLTTQLVSTANGTVVWDTVFESRTGDVFAVQDELTRSIVAALAPALRGQIDTLVLAERGTTDPAAYELYLNGNYHYLLRGPDHLQQAIALFHQAIARDPNFARAHAGLALANRALPIYNALPADSIIALVATSAQRAVALDSTLGIAQLAMANALEIQLRFEQANKAYRTAVELDPASATAHLSYGFSLLNLGRPEEALPVLHRALQLDPALKSAGSALSLGYLIVRRFPEALAASRAAIALDSTFPLAIFVQGQAQIFGGQPDSAVRTQERGVHLYPNDTRLLANLLLAYAATGRWADAQRIRNRLHAAPDAALIDGTEAARADLVFGDSEPLIRLLTSENSLRRYALGGGILSCNPLLDPLWEDVRFRAAMQRLGLEACPLAQPGPLVHR